MKKDMTEEKDLFSAMCAYGCALPDGQADHPFEGDFETTVLRHRESQRWFGLLMRVPQARIGREGGERIPLLNLKCAVEDAVVARELFSGVLPAYHMNKTHWISVMLDGSVPEEFIQRMLVKSYLLTKGKRK